MSYDNYQTSEATLHLMSSQENIKVLNEAIRRLGVSLIAELKNGGGVEIEI
jgi:antitoxin YefM